MKTLISWSGHRSQTVAQALDHYLPYIIPGTKLWFSAEKISAGSRWSVDLANQLAESQFGIICLTPENLNAPWLLFEAGSIASKLQHGRVVPYLFQLTPADVQYPLALFQGVQASREGTVKLVTSLNEALESPLSEGRLRESFDKWWPDLESRLKAIGEPDDAVAGFHRSDRELLEELVYLTRSHHYIEAFVNMPSNISEVAGRVGVRAVVYWHAESFDQAAASQFCLGLERAGVPATLLQHRDPTPPDSVFIGSLVGAEDARLVLTTVPYDVRYIFRPDYPTPEGGDASGLIIGVGYSSSHFKAGREQASEPVPITDDELQHLCEPGLSNTEFQRRLRHLSWGEGGS